LGKQTSLKEIMNPPRSALEAFRRLSVRQRMKVCGWISLAFVFIGFGLTYLSVDEQSATSGRIISTTGVIRSGPVRLEEDRSIVSYKVAVAPLGQPIYLRVYARKDGCHDKGLVVGQTLILSIQEMDSGFKVRHASTLNKCLLYDDDLGRDVRMAINESLYYSIAYFWGLGFVAFCCSLFYWRSAKPQI